MTLKNRTLMVGVEWLWLIIGAGVALAHLVEAWAAPHLPALWMVGVLALFLTYRFGLALRQWYWPASEEDEEQIFAEPVEPSGPRVDYRDDEDAPPTAAVVLPHIRGRKRRGPHEQQPNVPPADSPANSPARSTRNPPKIEVAAEAAELDANAATLTVDLRDEEDTDPRAEHIELRRETELDVTTSEITIPSFAESGLPAERRDELLDSIRGKERPKKAERPGGPRRDVTPAANEQSDTHPRPSRPRKLPPRPPARTEQSDTLPKPRRLDNREEQP